MNKKEDWKDGNAFLMKNGKKYTVNGQRAFGPDESYILAEDYDDNLKFNGDRNFWRDTRDVVKVISEKELTFDEWDGKPIPGKAWNDDDGFKYDVGIVGYIRGKWVCENANFCLERFDHVEYL